MLQLVCDDISSLSSASPTSCLEPSINQCHAADLAVQFRQSRTQWVQVHRLCMNGWKRLKAAESISVFLCFFALPPLLIHYSALSCWFLQHSINVIQLHLSTFNGREEAVLARPTTRIQLCGFLRVSRCCGVRIMNGSAVSLEAKNPPRLRWVLARLGGSKAALSQQCPSYHLQHSKARTLRNWHDMAMTQLALSKSQHIQAYPSKSLEIQPWRRSKWKLVTSEQGQHSLGHTVRGTFFCNDASTTSGLWIMQLRNKPCPKVAVNIPMMDVNTATRLRGSSFRV